MGEMIEWFNESPPRGACTLTMKDPFSRGWEGVPERDDRRERIDSEPPIIRQEADEPSPPIPLARRAQSRPRSLPNEPQRPRTRRPTKNGMKDAWTGPAVLAYLVFQPQPACFEPAQWGEWKQCAERAARGVGDNGGVGPTALPPHCSDCTRAYQAKMRLQGRCQHIEVHFAKGLAYLDEKRTRKLIDKTLPF